MIKDVIADAFLQQILTRPAEYDVIATLNLNGDYISDALAAQVGGIGIAPGANINYLTGHAIFEATHGTAPKYANQDKVNPGSVILSGEMMLRYLGWNEAADLIIKGARADHRAEAGHLRFRAADDRARRCSRRSEFGEGDGGEHVTRLGLPLLPASPAAAPRSPPARRARPPRCRSASTPRAPSGTDPLPDSITSGSQRRRGRPSASRNWPAATRMQS